MNGFCDNCRDYVDVKMVSEDAEKKIKGVALNYNKMRTFCKTCGNEMLISEIRDRNLKELETQYKKVCSKV
jgi:hypothetical protein